MRNNIVCIYVDIEEFEYHAVDPSSNPGKGEKNFRTVARDGWRIINMVAV